MITVQLPVKPYVKHFLNMKLGNPVNLAKNPQLYSLVRRCLIKPSNQYMRKYPRLPENPYSETVNIVISEDDFYRYGWAITNTDIVAIGKTVEQDVKRFMRFTVAVYEITSTQKKAIHMFQKDFGFTEDIWSYEAIKKDYYRSNASFGKDTFVYLLDKIKEKSLGNLSPERTCSPFPILNY